MATPAQHKQQTTDIYNGDHPTMWISEGTLVLEMNLPVIDPSQLMVIMGKEMATVIAFGANILRRNKEWFRRIIPLPKTADLKGTVAEYRGGILRLMVPVKSQE